MVSSGCSRQTSGRGSVAVRPLVRRAAQRRGAFVWTCYLGGAEWCLRHLCWLFDTKPAGSIAMPFYLIVCATWNAVQCYALSSVSKAAYQKNLLREILPILIPRHRADEIYAIAGATGFRGTGATRSYTRGSARRRQPSRRMP